MTKAIVSAATMQLVEEGKVGIDDPVSMYIPEFAEMSVGIGEDARPARRQITIRDFAHTHERTRVRLQRALGIQACLQAGICQRR